jgi:hypothetical protein
MLSASPAALRASTADVLADVLALVGGGAPAAAPAPRQEPPRQPSDAELSVAIDAHLDAQAELLSVSVKEVRLALEARFGGVSLLERRPLISEQVKRFVLEAARPEASPGFPAAAAAAPAPGSPVAAGRAPAASPAPASQPAAPGVGAALPGPATPSVRLRPAAARAAAPATAAAAAGASAPAPALAPATAAGARDSRHNPLEEPSGGRLPLVFPKTLGSYGSVLPVLVELCKPGVVRPLTLSGDSGAVGRVSMIDGSGQAHTASPDKNGKRKRSQREWTEEASERFRKGSLLQLDLKGDVYRGAMARSRATVCAVTIAPGKEAKVTAVFNSFLQARFCSNALEAFEVTTGNAVAATARGGDHEQDEGDEAEPAKKPAKKPAKNKTN